MLRSKTLLFAGTFMLFLIVANNVIHFVLTKHTLERNLERELSSVAAQIQISIDNSQAAARSMEEQIAAQLRTASVGAQYALDPDLEKVTNEQLEEVSRKLGVDHLTLMKQTADDIVLFKSSYPKELGVSTKKWVPWYQAFQELFDKHNVSIGWGQSLPNFWSGPFEYASSDPTKLNINKWGYYYDGSTNYMIDPFVSNENFEEFQNTTGIQAILQKTLESNEQLLEITGVNPATFGKKELKTLTDTGEELKHNVSRAIMFGEFRYQDAAYDEWDVQKAAKLHKTVKEIVTVNGTKVLKSFIPMKISPSASYVDLEGKPIDTYVLVITSNYDEVQRQLIGQFSALGLQILLVTLASVVGLLLAVRFMRRLREKSVLETQDTYIDEVNQLFTVVKGQRHDFLNHVQIIHALVAMNKTEDLRKYTRELVGDIRQVSDIMAIGEPAIAALVQAKTAVALSKYINFTHRFGELDRSAIGVKSVDIVKIVGNLIDNAFDAVMDLPPVSRNVELQGWMENGHLHMTVWNEGCRLTQEQRQHMFTPGFTTKRGGHSGLGLSIAKSLLLQYKGDIAVEADEEKGTVFHISLPIH
ncbi:sensor histidine kinase [Paenibacillus sp. MBLB4367]|uniref:sensor histidine kinase n=1 Tax=Paenibacillus sp. MBLB4367 TaxID=3384767 RepID=UPI00390817AB